ncbi:HAD-IIIA family hydrolase [Candidatus Margulisiibacteriota bacterium]
MSTLICCDRDGTINDDCNFYLGRESNWQEHVSILPGVIEGIRQLNAITDSSFFIITNQPGVAVTIDSFKQLTEERVKDVNRYINNLLNKEGLKIDGTFYCPYASREYIEKTESRGWRYDPAYIQEDPFDMKPNIGMIKKAAEALEKELSDFENIYVIGDRESDILAALNAGGKGIWVPSPEQIRDKHWQKTKKLKDQYPDKVYMAEDFPDAAEWIVKDTNQP